MLSNQFNTNAKFSDFNWANDQWRLPWLCNTSCHLFVSQYSWLHCTTFKHCQLHTCTLNTCTLAPNAQLHWLGGTVSRGAPPTHPPPPLSPVLRSSPFSSSLIQEELLQPSFHHPEQSMLTIADICVLSLQHWSAAISSRGKSEIQFAKRRPIIIGEHLMGTINAPACLLMGTRGAGVGEAQTANFWL